MRNVLKITKRPLALLLNQVRNPYTDPSKSDSIFGKEIFCKLARCRSDRIQVFCWRPQRAGF